MCHIITNSDIRHASKIVAKNPKASLNLDDKLDIIYALNHKWNIKHLLCQDLPKGKSQPILNTNYLRHWTSDYLLSQIQPYSLTLEHDGIIYDTQLVTGYCWGDIKESSKVKCSFRVSNKLNVAVCLIKPKE